MFLAVDLESFLRRVEARARWAADRAVEGFSRDPEAIAVLAELVEPGLEAEGLLERAEGVLARNREAWSAVIGAGTIDALGA